MSHKFVTIALYVLVNLLVAGILYAMMRVGINLAPLAGQIEGKAPGWGYAMMLAWLALTFAVIATPIVVAEKNGWLRRMTWL